MAMSIDNPIKSTSIHSPRKFSLKCSFKATKIISYMRDLHCNKNYIAISSESCNSDVPLKTFAVFNDYTHTI